MNAMMDGTLGRPPGPLEAARRARVAAAAVRQAEAKSKAAAQPVPQGPDYIVGLDLGQAQDFTALAVVERTVPPPVPPPADPPLAAQRSPCPAEYTLRHLQRWHLGTKYTAIADDVAALLLRPPLPGCRLVVDATGVGKPVVEMLRKAIKEAKVKAALLPVLITAGHETTSDGDTYRVPKKELVGTLQSLLQGRRLLFAKIPERDLLLKELANFRVKVTAAANEIYQSVREGQHDDMVLALALACWCGERPVKRFWVA